MGIHDARYKQLHQQARINLDWSRFVSQQLQLGEVEPRSLRSHRAHYVSDHYRERFGDRHWSFRTDRNAYLLLVCEFQSAPDNRLILRLYHYAFAQLLDGLDDGTFQVASGLPVPILVALYTGRQAWDPPSLSDLLLGPLVHESLFSLFFFDMRHMDARAIPDEGWLPGLFALERQADPAGILAGSGSCMVGWTIRSCAGPSCGLRRRPRRPGPWPERGSRSASRRRRLGRA